MQGRKLVAQSVPDLARRSWGAEVVLYVSSARDLRKRIGELPDARSRTQ